MSSWRLISGVEVSSMRMRLSRVQDSRAGSKASKKASSAVEVSSSYTAMRYSRDMYDIYSSASCPDITWG
jgi:hypothetical protein